MGVTDDTIDKIKQMLVEGELRAGEKLPVEKDLALRLGVSRGSLREAVRALTTLRVLHSRQGDGTYVTSLSPDLLLDGVGFVADLHRGPGILDFLRVRRLLESEATALATHQITPDDLTHLDELLNFAEELASQPEVDYERLVANDRDFHAAIVACCGNPVLAGMTENIAGRTVRARVWRGLTDTDAVGRTVAEHRGILRALRDGDAERARLLASVHVLGVEDAVRAAADGDHT